ncbi:MAG: hypothetical protein EXS35_03330 [Pedosphaera sp.]|nr:hypothetical protein [Pedosphaera sp.]
MFEIFWAEIPTAAELDAGFISLSAAGRAAGESFAALQSERLAKDYLTVRGWTADLTKPKHERTKP